MTENKLRKYFQGQLFYDKNHRGSGKFKNNFKKSKKEIAEGIRKEIDEHSKKTVINEIVKKHFSGWENQITNNFFLNSYPNIKDREKLDKLADYGNKILALIFVEDKLLTAKELLEKPEIEEESINTSLETLNKIISTVENIEDDEYVREILNLEKDGKNYSQIITDTISQLNEKIKGHQEETETESPLGEEDLSHESTADSERENLTFKTNNNLFFTPNFANYCLEIKVAKEEDGRRPRRQKSSGSFGR